MAWHWGNGMGWWMLFGGILWVAFWVSLIYLGIWLVRGSGRSRDGGTEAKEEPLAILKRRYAQGEINHEEFERMRKHLGDSAGPVQSGTNGASTAEEVKPPGNVPA